MPSPSLRGTGFAEHGVDGFADESRLATHSSGRPMKSDTLAQALPAARSLAELSPSRFSLELATVSVLWRRDLKRLFRQRSRLIGALGQPLIFWLVVGSGLGGTFRVQGSEGLSYLTYFFPGILAMVVLFTSIFSTMSVIEDRREGFLQSVLTAPGSRGALALGKILGGTTVATLQVGLFTAMAPLAGFGYAQVSWGLLASVTILSSIGLTALGFGLAWFLDSTQGYHAIMSILLIPLWVLSGAMFPVQSSSAWLSLLMRLNPMTYCVEATRRALYGVAMPSALGLPGSSGALELGVVAAFAISAVAVAVGVCRRRG